MDSKYWIERCQQLDARLFEQDQEIKENKKQLEDAYEHMKVIETDRKNLIQELKNTKMEMESITRFATERKNLIQELKNTKMEMESITRFARIGVAVRVRFLEKAKNQAMGLMPSKLNAEFLQRGNDAAHRAYVAVDAALFTSSYLKNNEKAKLGKIFSLIYDGLSPQSYGNLPPKMLQAVNHQGSIVSLLSRNDGSMTIKDKQAASDSMHFLKAKRLELGDDAFEKDENVARHLKRLEEFADLIISKRHGAPPLATSPKTYYGPPQASPSTQKRTSTPQARDGRKPPKRNHPSK